SFERCSRSGPRVTIIGCRSAGSACSPSDSQKRPQLVHPLLRNASRVGPPRNESLIASPVGVAPAISGAEASWRAPAGGPGRRGGRGPAAHEPADHLGGSGDLRVALPVAEVVAVDRPVVAVAARALAAAEKHGPRHPVAVDVVARGLARAQTRAAVARAFPPA